MLAAGEIRRVVGASAAHKRANSGYGHNGRVWHAASDRAFDARILSGASVLDPDRPPRGTALRLRPGATAAVRDAGRHEQSRELLRAFVAAAQLCVTAS